MARGGVGDQRKAGAVRRPKPKDHGGIGIINDGALNVVAPGEVGGPLSFRDCLRGNIAPDQRRRAGVMIASETDGKRHETEQKEG